MEKETIKKILLGQRVLIDSNNLVAGYDEALENVVKMLDLEAIPIKWIEKYLDEKHISPTSQIDKMLNKWRTLNNER